MALVSYYPRRLSMQTAGIVAALILTAPGFTQTVSCPKHTVHEATPAESAYFAGRYTQAEQLYRQTLAANPGDLKLSASLVSTLLRQHQVTSAAAEVDKMIAANPESAITLTTQAEVQLHQGDPWLTLDTLKRAAAIDPCYAQIHLVRANALRLDSMYASERAEIQKAYDLDPTNPDIRHAYNSIVLPANDIVSIDRSLKSTQDIDADTRQKAEESVRSMMPLLSENNQTCQVLPTTPAASFPLEAWMQDAHHVEGYRLEVEFPKSKARLKIDTAASGLYISRAKADENGFEPSPGAPPGTVHVDSLKIGPLEFQNCMVGVSDTPFPEKSDGLIGTDMFARWLITLDQPGARLTLAPLPARDAVIPGDRVIDPSMRDWMSVYHRQQFLLVPVTLDSKTKRLFILDSGIRFSTMTPQVAHSVSNLKVNFTNSAQTTSGTTLQFYRDSFDFQFANLNLSHQNHILQLDQSSIEENTGMQVGGMLGFDMLQPLVMHLDYRDGLVKLDPTESRTTPGGGNKAVAALNAQPDCGPEDNRPWPIKSTIQAKVLGLLDSAHLKPGKEIYVKSVTQWSYPGCDLPRDSYLFGHITASSSSKSPNSSELSIVFDHAQCSGSGKKPVTMRILGLVAPPDQFIGTHTSMPTEVGGKGREISDTAADMGEFLDENMNPGGPPQTVKPGIVLGIPKVKLEPQGGPDCSTRFTSTESSLRIGIGSELILMMVEKVKQPPTAQP